jgi:cytochrome P450
MNLEIKMDKVKLTEIDLMNLEIFAGGESDKIFAALRSESPMFWHSTAHGQGFWVLSKYEDILQAWRETKALSSEYGNMLRLQGKKDPAAGRMMVVTDPPHHTRLRRLHNSVINLKSVAAMEPFIHGFVCELLDQVETGQVFDFVEEITAKLPVGVTCQLLGIPRSDWQQIAKLSRSSFAAEDPEYWQGKSAEETLASVNLEILLYFFDLITSRRQNLGQDLISLLIEADIDGAKLSDTEIAMNCFSFLLGGNETTKYAAAGGLVAFLHHPDQWHCLQQDISCLDTAVEEVLRWTTPNIHVMRVARQDITIRDQNILQGQMVTLWHVSANRDEDIFPNPYQFNISRHPNRHMTFGAGPHYCLGADIARLELKVLFREVIQRGYEIEVVGSPIRLNSNFLAGYKHLPINFRRIEG